MAKTTDTAAKLLAAINPAELLVLLGLSRPGAAVTLIDTDLSNAVRTPDKLIRVEVGGRTVLVHVEYQTTPDAGMDGRTLAYNVWARSQYGLPVVSVVLVLLRSALSPQNTGRVVEFYDADARMDFAYRLIRLWELPVDALLAGPVTTLPFALFADFPPAELPAVVGRIRRRLADAPPRDRPKDVWAAARFFLDQRYTPEQLEALMLTDADLEQTATYQRIIRKGRAEGEAQGRAAGLAEGLRQTLLGLGAKKFGPPSRATRARIAAAGSDPLNRWTQRLLTADTWGELVDAD